MAYSKRRNYNPKPIAKLPPIKLENPSKYQGAIFNYITNDSGHLVIEATAGSGKTTTIVVACQSIPTTKNVAFLAFNKSIATELQRRVPDHCKASTFHSAGYGACIKAFGRMRVEAGKTRNTLKAHLNNYYSSDDRDLFRLLAPPISNLISLAKAHLVLSGEAIVKEWFGLADRFGIDVDFSKIDRAEFEEILSDIYEKVINQTSTVDFDDQIFFPIAKNLPVKQYDVVMVDESQDMNPARHELALRMLKPNGRMIIVGDSSQAIYGFTGADTSSMSTMRDKLAAIGKVETLPLSICYRCAKSVVAKAKEFCPSIEASESSPEGTVQTIKYDKFIETVASGDYVLCRTSAPTIGGCLALIREGRKAKVLGRELVKGLVTILKKADKIEAANMSDKLSDYKAIQTDKMKGEASHAKIMALQDKIDCLLAVLGHAIQREDWSESNAVELIEETLESIFTDDESNPGVTFSTIHKAKGLESDNIFIMHPELLPHPMASQPWEQVQEKNLAFVAATRAKLNLYYVDMGDKTKKKKKKK